MKAFNYLYAIPFFFLLHPLNAQLLEGKTAGLTITKEVAVDTTIRVQYFTTQLETSNIAYLLDGVMVAPSVTNTIDPNSIENIEVDGQPYEYEGKRYVGKILISTKDTYTPRLVSLKALVDEYLQATDLPDVFSLNGKTIHLDSEEYIINKNFILKIEVEEVIQREDDIHFRWINLLTRTEENIRKSSTIRLRGQPTTLFKKPETVDPHKS